MRGLVKRFAQHPGCQEFCTAREGTARGQVEDVPLGGRAAGGCAVGEIIPARQKLVDILRHAPWGQRQRSVGGQDGEAGQTSSAE